MSDTKVTLRDPADMPATPSQKIVADANRVVSFEDDNGRRLAIKKPNLVEQMRFLELLGPETSKNEIYAAVAGCAYAVVEIDGESVRKPVNRRELEVLFERLEEVGIQAVQRAFQEHFSPAEEPTKRDLKNG